MLIIAENISKKEGYLLLEFWTLGLGRRSFDKVDSWTSNAFRYRKTKWKFKGNGRMDIWLEN